jgi:Uma2 family endonuclease
MASTPHAHDGLTLEEFLRLPDIEEAPALEYIDGRVVRKAMPKRSHSSIGKMLCRRLDDFAEPRGLGESFPELRCTFAGRSIVPDLVFLRAEHVAWNSDGSPVEETDRPPDIHIEILSPDQSARETHLKLLHSVANGCPLGWLFDPSARTIDVYRPGRTPERLAEDGVLEGEPVLPGFRLPSAEVFEWPSRRTGPR